MVVEVAMNDNDMGGHWRVLVDDVAKFGIGAKLTIFIPQTDIMDASLVRVFFDGDKLMSEMKEMNRCDAGHLPTASSAGLLLVTAIVLDYSLCEPERAAAEIRRTCLRRWTSVDAIVRDDGFQYIWWLANDKENFSESVMTMINMTRIVMFRFDGDVLLVDFEVIDGCEA
jgi:hypothetical protein